MKAPIDEARYKTLVKDHAGLVYSICMAYGFDGADLDEMVQEVWLNLWKSRTAQLEGESDVAYLAGVARKTCQMAVRSLKTKKRAAVREYRFHERDTGEITNGTINGAHAFNSAEQERLCDQKALRANVVELAGMLRPTQEQMFIERLDSGGSLTPETQAPKTQIAALRRSRRILNLPVDRPRDAEITNPEAHLARVMRDHRAQRAGAVRPSGSNKKEMSCVPAKPQTNHPRASERTEVVNTATTIENNVEPSSASF